MEKNKKKRKRFPKKIIAASLLVIVLAINFVYSSLQNVEAKGIFASVETKAKEASEGNGTIRLLEILPDDESMGMLGMLIKGKEPFADIIADYSDEEIYKFAEMLNKYGIINMDSTSSAVYPLTYYKPGDQDKFTSNVPDLTEEQVGYGLGEQNLVAGYFQEVSASELESEKVYYQEIIVTATPIPTETPIPTPEGTETPTPSPTEGAEITATPVPTESQEVTATPVPTEGEAVSTTAPTAAPTGEAAPTITEEAAAPTQEAQPTSEVEEPTVTEVPQMQETASLHKDIRKSVVVAQADVQKNEEAGEQVTEVPGNEGESAEPTAIPTEPIVPLSDIYFTDENGNTVYLNYSEEGFNNSTETGRFFRFIAAEEGLQAPDNSYSGVGYQFVFVSRAEIRNNDLFKRFVLGITDEMQLQNVRIELTSVSVDGLTGITSLTDYDLVYMAQPIFYSPAGTDQIYEWAYANPQLSVEDKRSDFSPWVTLAATNNTSFDTAAKRIVADAVNSTDPLKFVVDTSILDEFERAITLYSGTLDTLEGMNIAGIPQETLEILENNGIYKALLLLAQDDFTTAIGNICTVENELYVVDDDLWNAEGLTDTLHKNVYADTSVFQTTEGHYVNKNIYFYKHINSHYDRALCTTEILSMLNGDFRSTFRKSILATHFADVVTAIDYENETNAYFESDREQINADEISTDMVLQYLLNYTGEAVEIKKNHISVLEIEPCADFSYDYKSDGSMSNNQKAFIDKWINYFAQQNRYSDVSFTCMSMQEFIGKNEDLNATYDMIYIGSNIGKFQQTNGVRRFNDTGMTGLVYTHVGDLVGKKGGLSEGFGLLDRDYTSSSRTTFNSSLVTDMRTTGNDLTTYKKRDLLNFLSSGYPVIVADNLLTYTTDSNTNKKVPSGINAEGQMQDGGVTDTSDTRTVYVRKPTSWTGWDTLYAHIWKNGGGNYTSWPGNKVEYVNESGGYYVYRFTVPKAYDTIIIHNGSDQLNQVTLGNKDAYTLTFGTYPSISATEGAPSGMSSGKVTVDNSTYLYQVLKIATAQTGTVDVDQVERTTLNYDPVLQNIVFDWDDRTFPNLLTNAMTDAEAHKTSPEYLNETKVFLNLTNQPTAYNYNTTNMQGKPVDESTVAYLTANSDGRYYLTYEFSISTLAGTLSTNTYDCQLFVDANFDGKFSENSEQLDSVVIKEASTGQIVTREDGENVYHLKENTAYTLSRKLPKSFDGCINWKLQVTQNGHEEILASETGYCAIPVTPKTQNGSVDTTSDKQKINILQITSGTSTAENKYNRITWNGTHVNMEYSLNNGSDAWHNLLNNIPDFELKIKTVSASEFANACAAYDSSHPTDIGGYAVNLVNGDNEKYDMLVVGFIDVFSVYGKTAGSTTGEAAMAEAINRFGNTGKSILFTHDTTSWNGDYQKKGTAAQYGGDTNALYNTSYLTVAIRDLCGNDQYGLVTRIADATSTLNPSTYISQFFKNTSGNTKASATGNSYTRSNTSAWEELIGLGKDMAFKANSNQEAVVGETQGSTYINLRNTNYDFGNGSGNADTYVQYFKNMIPSGRKNTDMFDSNASTAEQYEIGKVNEGAITEYPYKLPDFFNVSSTHPQYWTVDIESDSNDDGESDLVVWYCINSRSVKGSGTTAPIDDFYASSPNDVRNNYYIYNKGNITYSGAGHSPISNENEIKLFINTMIAAYNAQIKVPEISIVESDEPEAPEVDNIIIPYDTSVNSDDVDFVNFGTGDAGTAGQMKIYFNVYDGNLTARDKNIKIDSIFISDTAGTDSFEDESGNIISGRKYINSSQMKIYDAVNDQEAGYEHLISGRTYYIYADIGEIFKTDQSIQLHVQMHTEIGRGSSLQSTPTVSDCVTIGRAEIFDLD